MTQKGLAPLRALKPPATCTLLYHPEQVTPELVRVVCGASCVLQDLLQTVSRSRRDVELERSILSRVLYNCSCGHHMQKYYHSLKTIEKCLNRYIEMNLPAAIEEIEATMPRCACVGEVLRLPSRQMVEHVQLRLRDAACLMSRTHCYARQAAILVRQQMTMGLFVPKMVVFEGLLARIWVYSRAMVTCLQTWYTDLNELRSLAKASQMDWLPKGYKLPENLDEISTQLPTHDSDVLEDTSAVSQVSAAGSSVTGDTTLQRYCTPSLKDTVESAQDDTRLPAVPSDDDMGQSLESAEDIGLPVVSAEDIGLPVRRDNPDTIQPCVMSDMSTRRRHWLTRLKSCSDVSEMLAILDELKKVVPGLDDSEVVSSTRTGLVELLEAFNISGKLNKKKRKVITKTSRKVLSQIVKKTFSKKVAKKRKTE